MFNAISVQLMHAFSINATQLGELSAYYFVANVIFLFVAGILLDRYSTKLLILTSLIVCILGIALFSITTDFMAAAVARFLTGIGSAFCFLSVIRLASRWFPPRRMAFVIGIVVTIAMAGGMTANTPFELLAELVGWRNTLLVDVGLGVVFFFLIFLIVKDYPLEDTKAHEKEQQIIDDIGYFKSLKMAFLKAQNWLAGIYTCLMNLPIIVLGGLWGALYLMDTHGLTKEHATFVASMLFFGTIIGSPIVGWISDKMALRRPPMIIGSILALMILIVLIVVSNFNYVTLIFMFLFIGIVTSTQIISYPLITESSPREVTAMSVSVINITTQAGIALFQPVYGRLMDLHVLKRLHHPSTQFISSDFNWATWLFPIGIGIALLAAVAIKETYAREESESTHH